MALIGLRIADNKKICGSGILPENGCPNHIVVECGHSLSGIYGSKVPERGPILTHENLGFTNLALRTRLIVRPFASIVVDKPAPHSEVRHNEWVFLGVFQKNEITAIH